MVPLVIVGIGALIVMASCETVTYAFRYQGPSSNILRTARTVFLLGGTPLGIVLVLLDLNIWGAWYCRGSGVGAC
jgi:hypothetical protein